MVRALRDRWLLWMSSATFVALSLPVLIVGAPLADDFPNCLRPVREGLSGMLTSSLERLGAVRPARFVEILVTTGVCQHLPFAFAIAVPLLLTLVVAWQLAGLLRDLGCPGLWPQIGAAIWLLQPLGVEAALWPAALHVPLALACALGALRLFGRGRVEVATVLALGAMLSAEQTILALPVAAWMLTPRPHRHAATIAAGAVAITVLVVYVLWTGDDPRFTASPAERLRGVVADPVFYVQWIAQGLGAQSIPLGLWWALPFSVPLLAVGAGLGWGLARNAHPDPPTQRLSVGVMWSVALLVATNVPLLLNVPRQGSPRTFTPTWLILAAAVALVGPAIPWKRVPALGSVAGMLVVGAMCSIALTVAVRVQSAVFFEEAVEQLADRTEDGDTIAVCDVRRTVSDVSLRGAYAIHDLMYPWSASGGLEYYTGRRATVTVAGPGPGGTCPDDADLRVDFGEIAAGDKTP